jgi:regulatory protein
LRYLSYQPRSETEIRSYLRRLGYLSNVVENVLGKLRSLNYLNDESFARSWALSRVRNRGYGPTRIEQELRSKGIVQATIREIMRETFEQENEETRAKQLLAKRFTGQNFKEPKVSRRAAAFLQRRGYGAKVIFALLKVPIEED